MQDDVAGIRTAAIRFPEFGVLVERDPRIHGAQSDRLMAVLRVASDIVPDAGNALVGRNLIKQPWQERRVADTVAGRTTRRQAVYLGRSRDRMRRKIDHVIMS